MCCRELEQSSCFHNGAADTLGEVISFYDRRFHIGFTAQEIADLQAFLEALRHSDEKRN